MEGKLQHQIAFYLTGRRSGTKLRQFDASYRPCLLSRFTDLSSLRYDMPVVLNRNAAPEWSVLSLTKLVDDAIDGLFDNPEYTRIARHAYSLEREVRRDLASGSATDLATLWNNAAAKLTYDSDETVKDSAIVLWSIFNAGGEVADADAALPARMVTHAWSSVQASKAKSFRQKAERLLLKLRSILAAEVFGSASGRAPDRLRAGVGSSFAGSFDFDAMSSILISAKPATGLSTERRVRVQALIDVLERQRFFSLKQDGPEPYSFAFDRCSDALSAYNQRSGQAIELVRTLAIAELEANGEYRESVHDLIFEGFGANGLDSSELAQLPDYLICTDGGTLDPAETAQMVELLAAGLPFKVLVRTDDVLQPSAVAEGHVTLGLRARQLVDTAVGLTDVFVFQSTSAQLFKKRESLLSGLTFDGPALFSVFSGANGHTGENPAYLIAAAATDSRVFPTLVYDPSAGPDWASRLCVDDNPSPEGDWPEHSFEYEDQKLQARSETVSFTLADLMALDDRFFGHFAIVPETDWNDAMIPVSAALDTKVNGLPDEVPSILLVGADGCVARAIFDDRTLLEVARCRTMWHSLQELGGIHNSHAERLLAKEMRKSAETVATDSFATEIIEPIQRALEPPVPEPAADEHGDDPYIETGRCTSCNECTLLNNNMFAYNENKQAFVADADAGTFRHLVEAAEGCQVGIIHPGKPRNPKEPGLEDLIRRASAFV